MSLSLAFPEVCDALTAAFSLALGADNVFDGPPAQMVRASGLAIGATREDVSSEFSSPPAVTCLAWSGGGDVVFKPHRDAVNTIMTAVAEQLAADRTLGGVADTAYMTGGTWMQEQTGDGALVTCEFRIVINRF
jgi:hypothetical protein